VSNMHINKKDMNHTILEAPMLTLESIIRVQYYALNLPHPF